MSSEWRSKGKPVAPHRSVPVLLEMIGAAGGELTALTTHRATLDDVFLAMTGRALRDE